MGVEGWNGESEDKIPTMTVLIVHLPGCIFSLCFAFVHATCLAPTWETRIGMISFHGSGLGEDNAQFPMLLHDVEKER